MRDGITHAWVYADQHRRRPPATRRRWRKPNTVKTCASNSRAMQGARRLFLTLGKRWVVEGEGSRTPGGRVELATSG